MKREKGERGRKRETYISNSVPLQSSSSILWMDASKAKILSTFSLTILYLD